ncbi:MAG: hypothetical protein R2716_03240 [Microthrixaceae bacterium]
MNEAVLFGRADAAHASGFNFIDGSHNGYGAARPHTRQPGGHLPGALLASHAAVPRPAVLRPRGRGSTVHTSRL